MIVAMALVLAVPWSQDPTGERMRLIKEAVLQGHGLESLIAESAPDTIAGFFFALGSREAEQLPDEDIFVCALQLRTVADDVFERMIEAPKEVLSIGVRRQLVVLSSLRPWIPPDEEALDDMDLVDQTAAGFVARAAHVGDGLGSRDHIEALMDSIGDKRGLLASASADALIRAVRTGSRGRLEGALSVVSEVGARNEDDRVRLLEMIGQDEGVAGAAAGGLLQRLRMRARTRLVAEGGTCLPLLVSTWPALRIGDKLWLLRRADGWTRKENQADREWLLLSGLGDSAQTVVISTISSAGKWGPLSAAVQQAIENAATVGPESVRVKARDLLRK